MKRGSTAYLLGAFMCAIAIVGCTTAPKPRESTAKPASPAAVPPALPAVPPPDAPPPPPTEVFSVTLKNVPRQSFHGVSQAEWPQPLWSLDHYHPLGHPAISPDGRWLALNRAEGKEGKVIVLVDLVSRKSSEHLVPPPGLVGPPVFSRDSQELWSVVNSPTGYGFARWSLPSMTLRVTPLESGEAITAAFTAAQDRVVVMRANGVAGVFDLASTAKLREVTFHQDTANFYFTSLVISPDDQFVSSGVIHPGNEYVRWRLADGLRVDAPAPKEHLSWGRPALSSRDGQTIFVAAHHELIAVDAATGCRRSTYPGNGLNTLHYQPTVDLMAAPVGQGETFALIDGTSGQIRFSAKHAARPPAEYGYVNWAAVAPDGRTAYSANYFSIFAWDLSVPLQNGPDWLTIGHTARTLLPSADGASLVAVGETVDTWDLRSRRLLATQPSWLLRGDRAGDINEEWRTGRGTAGVWRAGDAIHALRLDNEGAQIYDVASETPLLRLGTTRSAGTAASSASTPATKALWQSPSAYPRGWPETFPYQGGYLQTAASPDARHLVVTTFDGPNSCVTLWDLKSGRRLAVLADGLLGARVARFSPDGKRVLVASSTGGLAIFHLNNGLVPTLEVVSPGAPNGRIHSAPADVANPAADRVYVGTSDGVLQSWHRGPDGWHLRFEHRITDNNTSAQFHAPVARLAVSPSGRTLAVALFNPAEQGSILIIDAETGAIRSRLDDHVSDLCFINERTLASTGIRIWTLDQQ